MADEKEPGPEAKPEPKKIERSYEPPGPCPFCRNGCDLGCDVRCPNCGRVGAYYGG